MAKAAVVCGPFSKTFPVTENSNRGRGRVEGERFNRNAEFGIGVKTFALRRSSILKLSNQKVETPLDGTIQFGASKQTSLVVSPHRRIWASLFTSS
jgi:hypothetical protein